MAKRTRGTAGSDVAESAALPRLTIPDAGWRVLGIDPGTQRMGLALVWVGPPGQAPQVISGVTVDALVPVAGARYRVLQRASSEPELRLRVMRQRMMQVLASLEWDVYGVEQPRFGTGGALTAFYLGAAWHSAVQLVTAGRQVPGYVTLDPSTVDRVLGVPSALRKHNRGRSQKSLRRDTVADLVGQDWSAIKDSSADADWCDAVAVALATAWLHRDQASVVGRGRGHRTKRTGAAGV